MGRASGSVHRQSRHSRRLSMSTRHETFEVMTGKPLTDEMEKRITRMEQKYSNHTGRASVRFSALEAASILFPSASDKPLPSIPDAQQWRDGMFDLGTDTDEHEGRDTALDKLEGRVKPVTPIKEEMPQRSNSRSFTPSWLHTEKPHALEEETRRESDAYPVYTPTQVPAKVDVVPSDAPLDTPGDTSSRSLRPLQLSMRNAQGTPLLRDRREPSEPPKMTKTSKRISGIHYKGAAVFRQSSGPPSLAAHAEDTGEVRHSKLCRAATFVSGSGQSSKSSWPLTDAAESGVFSTKSGASSSPEDTSVESTEQTPKRSIPHAAPSRVADVDLLFELELARERHQREQGALQRELEEVRHMMGSQLVSLTIARDAAQERCHAIEQQLTSAQDKMEELESERDMYKEDIGDWRTRCSDLEQTIQSQQMRLKQEQTWRHAATNRMQALSNRLGSQETSFDSNSSGAHMSATQSGGASQSSSILLELPALPDLPAMPSDDELGGWSKRVARQISKHAPVDDNSALAPETARLLSDMRQQIMALYSELQLEHSNHELTRTQLLAAQEQASVQPVQGADTRKTSDASDPTSTPRPPDAAPSDAYMAAQEKVLHQRIASQQHAEPADVLFERMPGHHATESLVGLGLSPQVQLGALAKHDAQASKHTLDEPAWPETSQDMSWLEEDKAWDPSGVQEAVREDTIAHAQSTLPLPPHSPADDGACTGDAGELFVDTSSVFMEDTSHASPTRNEDPWTSDEESPIAPPRPEFIPEWSFDQAIFEASQDIEVYEKSCDNLCDKQAKRGAKRMQAPPVEDFFGILAPSAAPLPPLPLPTYALEMPPLDPAKLPPIRSPQPNALNSAKAPPSLRAGTRTQQRSLLARAAYLDENAPRPMQQLPRRPIPALDSQSHTVLLPTAPEEPAKAEYVIKAEQADAQRTVQSEAKNDFFSQFFGGFKSPWLKEEKPVSEDDPESHVSSTPTTLNAPFTSPAQAPYEDVYRTPTVDARPSPSNATNKATKLVPLDPQQRVPFSSPVWSLNFTTSSAKSKADVPFMI
ncbi:hypothetical protein MVES1_000785 [Malassezia vespertilionis]|uniref:uncharacterized protein n=1 Tax=Malassezia vespertilionis TaxID=2020962 RepID=UPI0024B0E33A|nr:uncharacterized protein MVES1_000785 [Malassezia vespertilionis]WFD05455.1 hypothetical protein MVES1_000785 [Malassezia vespertilionis]